MTRFLVDGMNVIGSKPDGWWRDRRGAMRRLVELLETEFSRPEHEGDTVAVVLDGAPFDLTSEVVTVAFATRRGRDAADDDIARLTDPGDIVVTSDDDLARRVRESGAEVIGAGAFRRQLEGR